MNNLSVLFITLEPFRALIRRTSSKTFIVYTALSKLDAIVSFVPFLPVAYTSPLFVSRVIACPKALPSGRLLDWFRILIFFFCLENWSRYSPFCVSYVSLCKVAHILVFSLERQLFCGCRSRLVFWLIFFAETRPSWIITLLNGTGENKRELVERVQT